MSDDPMGALPSFNRVSIRAVLAQQGEDVQAALFKAGIFDPVAVPVLVGDGQGSPGTILGDGVTSNPTGVLETERQEDFDSSAYSQPAPEERPAPAGGNEASPQRQTTTLPPAYGMQPLAPVGRGRR